MPDNPSDEKPAAEDESGSSGSGAPPIPAFPIVGLGASAGGVEAFKEFFSAMPVDSGMAFVAILHLDAAYKSHMADILSRCTTMPVQEVTGSTLLERNHLYLTPSNKELRLAGERLELHDLPVERLLRKPVDAFFRSLAEGCRERAIAIVLSGSGGDGSAGVCDINHYGGLVLVQDPAEAKYPAMPRSSLATGAVDQTLKIKEMPPALAAYAAHPYLSFPGEWEKAGETARRQLENILALLRRRTGKEFRHYKKNMLLRRALRRMGLRQITDYDQYEKLLLEDEAEVKALAGDMLIGVTRFFREPEAWEELRAKVLAPLTANEEKANIRVWVPGCATGEEAFSLLILLHEEARKAGYHGDIKLFATDADADRLLRAREGRFSDGIEGDVPTHLLERYFEKHGDSYQVKAPIRESIVFAAHDLTNDPPFSQLDLISCRNLLIYLEPEAQSRILGLFHFALREGGSLFLGNSETTNKQQNGLFETISKKWRIFRRIGPTRHDLVNFPLYGKSAGRREADQLSARESARPHPHLGHLVDHLLSSCYAPAAVLVNEEFQALYFHGSTDRYLVQPSGAHTANVLELAREGLRTKIREAMGKALATREKVTLTDARVRRENSWVPVTVIASPVKGDDKNGKLVLLTLEEGQPVPRAETPAATIAPGDEGELVHQLEEELRNNRIELQSTIGELETAIEEQKASNEEITSMNEELQSTNEELETSKEELQSLNEEMTTVNQQLQSKLQELESTNNDLSNLMASTDVATIFLDTQFRIRWFAPALKELISVIASDVGRPISDFSPKFIDPQLLEDSRSVLKSLAPIRREVHTEDNRWFSRRVLPYRTQDNRIEGVVITFVEITELQLAQQHLKEFNRELEQQVAQRTALAEQRAEQLRKLALDLSRVEETERRRIAQVLHDDLQQILTGALFSVKDLRESHDPKALDAFEKLLDRAIQTTRRLNQELSPAILHEGLYPALKWLVRWSKEQFGLNIKLHFAPDAEPGTPELRYMLFSACRELLFNVVKHAGASEATVRAEYRAPMLQIEVRDAGKGWKPKDDETDGTGLLNVRERITSLGGQFRIESSPGEGTCVTIAVPNLPPTTPSAEMTPRRLAMARVKAESAQPVGENGGLRVLIVDDHDVMRDGLKRLLLKEPGITVIGEAANGEEAMERVEQEHPDLVLMDASMPHMGGVEATRQIMSAHPEVAIIGLSMYEDADRAQAMLEAGAVSFVQKTTAAEKLVAAIRSSAPKKL